MIRSLILGLRPKRSMLPLNSSNPDVVHPLIGIGLIGIGLRALATIITLATRISGRKKHQTTYYQNQSKDPMS